MEYKDQQQDLKVSKASKADWGFKVTTDPKATKDQEELKASKV